MITANFTAAISHISNLDNVRRVSVSDDGSRVAVSAAVTYFDQMGEMSAPSERLFLDIEERLGAFGLGHFDSVVDESAAGDHHAVEIWFFVRY
jgi:hypothetical protein